MSTYKLAYNFRYYNSAPRRVDIAACSYQEAVRQLLQRLWWDCITPEDVVVNLVGKSRI